MYRERIWIWKVLITVKWSQLLISVRKPAEAFGFTASFFVEIVWCCIMWLLIFVCVMTGTNLSIQTIYSSKKKKDYLLFSFCVVVGGVPIHPTQEATSHAPGWCLLDWFFFLFTFAKTYKLLMRNSLFSVDNGTVTSMLGVSKPSTTEALKGRL